MIPKQAIEKAIEGGWKIGKDYLKDDSYLEAGTSSEIALDPTFWQALGKALGWKYPDYALEGGWGHYAHMFYRLILTGGDTEAFWTELLSDNKN